MFRFLPVLAYGLLAILAYGLLARQFRHLQSVTQPCSQILLGVETVSQTQLAPPSMQTLQRILGQVQRAVDRAEELAVTESARAWSYCSLLSLP